jgi:hypothetical protein
MEMNSARRIRHTPGVQGAVDAVGTARNEPVDLAPLDATFGHVTFEKAFLQARSPRLHC